MCAVLIMHAHRGAVGQLTERVKYLSYHHKRKSGLLGEAGCPALFCVHHGINHTSAEPLTTLPPHLIPHSLHPSSRTGYSHAVPCTLQVPQANPPSPVGTCTGRGHRLRSLPATLCPSGQWGGREAERGVYWGTGHGGWRLGGLVA